MKPIIVNVKSTIKASVNDTFNAIVDPTIITKYFFSETTGKLEQGAKLIWNFADVGVKCEVHVLKIIENSEIIFDWNAIGLAATRVNIRFSKISSDETKIEISESSFEFTEQGVKKAMGQTQGWTDFVCSLKAYLYTGINLRTGPK